MREEARHAVEDPKILLNNPLLPLPPPSPDEEAEGPSLDEEEDAFDDDSFCLSFRIRRLRRAAADSLASSSSADDAVDTDSREKRRVREMRLGACSLKSDLPLNY